MGSEEPNAIVQIGGNGSFTEPNVRATEQEIYEGLEASSQNCWPSVEFDVGGINNFISPFIPVTLLQDIYVAKKFGIAFMNLQLDVSWFR